MSSDNQLNYGLDMDTIDIADSVIIDVATKTLATIPGIHSLSPRFYDELVEGITHAFGQRSLPGINVKHRKGFIEINIYIKALYGYNLIELSKQLQLEIKQTLKNMLDLDHVKVDVHIEGIVKEKEPTLHGNEARQYAFQMLYANEFHADQNDVQFPEGHIHKSMDKAYANSIINGVLSASETIDATLQPFCKSRKVENLDKVDRAILRIALWEMTNEADPLEPSIAINEAIQLAKDFGSDSSYKLINAILDAYNKSK